LAREEFLRIGALADRTGRSVHAIRWYEAQGLLPRVERDSGGRRVYMQWHVDWLLFIGRLKNTGMPVKQMKRYALLIARGDSGLAEQEELLIAHRQLIEARRAEIDEACAIIDRKLKHYQRLRGAKTT
jgi:DNA-binding transcriptional MerR regulator